MALNEKTHLLGLQLAVNGIALGSLYALIAVGFALIFATTQIFHVVHGATYVIAAYVFVWASKFPLPLAFLLAILVAGLFGWLVNVCVYRPVQRARESFFTIFVASLGVTIVVENMVALIAGSDVKTPIGPFAEPLRFGNLRVPTAEVVGVIVAALLFLILRYLLRNTKTGVGMRAVADDPELMDILGMNPRRYASIALIVGSILVVPAATLTPYIQGVTPSAGLQITTLALVASIVGGVGSLPGAALGAMIFGVAQSLSTLFFNTAWQDAIAYSILLSILVIRPSGLLKKKATT